MSIPSAEASLEEALATTLLANLSAFQAFARNRLRDDSLAADAVQEGMLRALKSAGRLKHDENLVAWFYRILRNVIVDLHRAQNREATAMAAAAAELPAGEDRELESVACGCLRGLLPTLPKPYAEIVELAELRELPLEAAARNLGISKNNAKVRLHRARRQLRHRLEQTCGVCATHGCIDCSCNE